MDPAPTPCASDTPCSIYELGTTYQADFVSCSHPDAGGTIPNSVDTAGFSYCLWLNNVAGAASTFDFDLTVPARAGGEQLQCDSDNPNVLAAIQCPAFLPGGGNPFRLTFSATPRSMTTRTFTC